MELKNSTGHGRFFPYNSLHGFGHQRKINMKEQELSTSHYEGIKLAGVKLDPMLVYKMFSLHEKDESGALFHILKTVLRFGKKNSRKREYQAIIATAARALELLDEKEQ
jgi:hypothetical protein